MRARVRRRAFIGLLGGAMAGWSLDTSAQQPAMPVVGFLSSGSREFDASRLTAFRQGLNVAIEGSWEEHHTERLPALAADLARRPVTVIAAVGINAALGAKIATT